MEQELVDAGFNWVRVLEASIPFGILVIGWIVKESVHKNTMEHRVKSLEITTENHGNEMGELNSNLNATNNSLIELNVNVKNLTGWVKSIDKRQFDQ